MLYENIDRNALEEDAKHESALADMKQHADKLIHGFEAEDKTHPRRAIWELVQNARDLSDKCDIVIEYTSEHLKFTHNGKPFKSKTLLSLIKQVSSKNDDKLNTITKEEVEEVGQYGTGFITTHTFGKRFLLDGSLEVAEGTYITLKEFEIDRVAQNSKLLAEKLVRQQETVFSLLKEEGSFTCNRLDTTFTYLFTEGRERNNAWEALTQFTIHYIPLVMSLNQRIKSMRIVNHINGTEDLFEKGSSFIDDEVTVILIKSGESTVKKIYSLQHKELELIILLPLKERLIAEKWGEDTGRLFLHFPLVGTENWGSSFIIHCGKFSPTEKRDGLHLKSDKTQTKEKEENNRGLIKAATEMIIRFLKNNESKIKNPIILAEAAFQTNGDDKQVNDYFKELKTEWVKELKEIKLVETDDSLITPSATKFYDPAFCGQPDYDDAIYKVLKQFWKNIPKQVLTNDWTRVIQEWEDQEISFITIEDVAKKIEEEGNLDKFDETILKKFYKFLLSTTGNQIFDDNKLLPNIKRHFESKKVLHTADAIHPRFIKIADLIIPEVPQMFILKPFELTSDLPSYSRKRLSKDWNAKFIETAKNIAANSLLNDAFRDALISLCSTFPSLDKKGFRGDIMDIIVPYYKQTADYVEIPNIIDDEVEYDMPMRCLLKHFLFDLHKRSIYDVNWVESNIELILKVLETITGAGTKAYEDVIKLIPVFPNQNYHLKLQDDLLQEEDMPEGLKELYYEVMHTDIRNVLILDEAAKFSPSLQTKAGITLAAEINTHFESKGSYTEILDHPSRLYINMIIKRLTGKDKEIWMRLFPVISGKRETIMMSRITKKEMKDSMFNILDLEEEPEKIVSLGNLARDENMMRIIEAGREIVAQEESDKSDFEFKKSIGVHIESLLLQSIKSEMDGRKIKVVTQSKQDGQDIVVKYTTDDSDDKKDKIIYYIEIKSRWNPGNVVSMSRNQITQAVNNRDQYSLCVVDLVDFYPDNTNRHYPEDITLILHLISAVTDIGIQLKPLIENVMQSDLDDDAIKLTGDYRATVPKGIYDKGINFNNFIDFLTNSLLKSIANLKAIKASS